jgi:hypothetical protein
MKLTIQQMALMSRLLDEALPLDEAGRRLWLADLSPEYEELASALRAELLPEEGVRVAASRFQCSGEVSDRCEIRTRVSRATWRSSISVAASKDEPADVMPTPEVVAATSGLDYRILSCRAGEGASG